MKPQLKMKWLIALFFIAVSAQTVSAQTRADIFDEKVPVTFLGLDYTFAKFIPAPAKPTEMNNTEFQNAYTLMWNELLLSEPTVYNVATQLHRPSVKNAVDVAEKNNATLKKEFISHNLADYQTITEAQIVEVVKNYNFQGNTGLGLLLFVEGMSKEKTEAGIWITFVNMTDKTVLLTAYETGSASGFGFRNYWAKPVLKVIRKIGDHYGDWKAAKK